ncbi:MAG: TonB-dependent receptor [Gammaproteobacteria bacterium]|nr:TonB-dependent receptor [Gammaproteobacteria bacterium]
MQFRLIQTTLLVSSIFSSCLANAEQGLLNPVIVTATRTTQTVDNTLAPVTVISRSDIENSQASSVAELLTGMAGMDITSQGGLGTNTSLFLRGTNTNHTLFLVDGIRLGSATLGTTAIELIPLEQIDRIEIVRGPRSSLYGSEAIGGVVQLFTRQGSEATQTNLTAGYGTHNTASLSAGTSGATDIGSYSMQAAATKTDGIHVHDDGHPDKDGYQNQSVTASFKKLLGNFGEAALSLFHSEADNDYDNIYDATAINESHTRQNTINASLKFFAGDKLDNNIRLSQQRDEFDDFENAAANGSFNTLRKQALWQGDYHLRDDQTISLGYEVLTEEIETSGNYAETERDNHALFGQLQSEFSQQALVLAVRHDNNDAIGHTTTGNIDWRWNFSSEANITASYGRAFKAPTFNDLYWPDNGYTFGNPNLLAEESRSAEIGANIKSDNVRASFNIYKTRIENLIDWQAVDPGDPFSPWTPDNVNNAVISGMETRIETRLFNWDLAFNLNLIDPRDEQTNNRLQRRALKEARLDLDREFGKLATGVSLHAAGGRYDDAANTDLLPGYGLVNLRSSYALNKSLSVKGKIDNLFDKEYETIRDYNNLGRTIFVSLSYNIE